MTWTCMALFMFVLGKSSLADSFVVTLVTVITHSFIHAWQACVWSDLTYSHNSYRTCHTWTFHMSSGNRTLFLWEKVPRSSSVFSQGTTETFCGMLHSALPWGHFRQIENIYIVFLFSSYGLFMQISTRKRFYWRTNAIGSAKNTHLKK